MGLSTALATLEEVLLDIVEDGEPGAARCVGRGVDTVGACNPAGDRSYMRNKSPSSARRMRARVRQKRVPWTALRESAMESAAARRLKAMTVGQMLAEETRCLDSLRPALTCFYIAHPALGDANVFLLNDVHTRGGLGDQYHGVGAAAHSVHVGLRELH